MDKQFAKRTFFVPTVRGTSRGLETGPVRRPGPLSPPRPAWSRKTLCRCVLVLAIFFGRTVPGWAEGEPGRERDAPRVERTLFVPFDELSAILGGENERVFLTREQYAQLAAEAARKPRVRAPHPALPLEARYEAILSDGIAMLRGTITIEVLEPGLHALVLPLRHVALRRATWDDSPAPIGRDEQGEVVLFVRGVGRHELVLEGLAPVVVSAAEQSLKMRVPPAPSTTVQLVVPGNVEVKSGASLISRVYDPDADRTRMQGVVVDGSVDVILSLNNRLLREERVVLARSVLISELTTSYERLHATVDMRVLHGAADRFLFQVPSGFQVTHVATPLLSQWIIRTDPERDGAVLEVLLREPARGNQRVEVAASRSPVELGTWSMPVLRPLEIAGHTGVLGLVGESRLRPLALRSEHLIQIDASLLRQVIPAGVLEAEPGAPQIRPLAAFYAPHDTFTLTAALEDPQDELRVATHLLLTLQEQQQILRGGFTLTPQASKQTTFAFRLPEAWQLAAVHAGDHHGLAHQRYPAEGATRFVVTLPRAVEAGQSVTVYFEAHHRSSAWLGDWTSTELEFPHVTVEQATGTKGAIAIQPEGDLTVAPLTTTGLIPLDSSQRGRFGLSDTGAELTYRVIDEPYQATFRAERTRPRISARNYSFFTIRDGSLSAHYEIVYVIERAHANRLELDLPDTTPTALSFRGLGEAVVKEFFHTAENGRHRWTILLAQAHQGAVHLAVDFEQRRDENDAANDPLPLIRAANVAYQTQMVSIEGDPSLDITIHTSMRPVDVGELVEAEYVPGPRLLGTFASTADPDNRDVVELDVARRALHGLPGAIVQRAELVTLISASGVSQSAARYLLHAKVPLLAVQLPADAELWSVTLNGQPTRPRRRGEQILLSVQTDRSDGPLDLQVVYESPVSTLAWIGRLQTSAPQLWLAQHETDQGTPVPQVDLVWHVHMPGGYHVSRVHGNVFSASVTESTSPWRLLADAGRRAGGGIHGLAFGIQAAREPASQAVSTVDSPPSMVAGNAVGSMRRFGQSEPFAREDEMCRAPAFPFAPNPEPFAREDEMAALAPPLVVEEEEEEGEEMIPESQRHLGERALAEAAAAGGRYMQEAARGYGAAKWKYWALQGLRGVTIHLDNASSGVALGRDLKSTAPPVTFRSLGADPRLDVTVFDQRRMEWLAWGTALVILVVGLAMTRVSLRARVRFVVVIALLACGLPVFGGPTTEFRDVCQGALLATLALIPLWVLIAFLALPTRWLARRSGSLHANAAVGAIAALAVLAALAAAPHPAQAQDLNEILKPWLEPSQPVRIPDDAVVIPYDPDDPRGQENATQVLVPYQRYIELWNLAYPDRKMDSPRSEHTFALAGAEYEAALEEADHLVLRGTLRIDVFTDRSVAVPLTLRDGVITSAQVDGRPARLTTVRPSDPPSGAPSASNQPKTRAKKQLAPPSADRLSADRSPAVVFLMLEGKGRYQLDLSVRVAVTRQGGWRSVQGTVPHAPATAVKVTIPEAGTSLRRTLEETVLTETTTEDHAAISTTLRDGGRFELAWRGPIAPGSVDQALTATSVAVIDVREDGVRGVWRVDFAFGQTDRGQFRLGVPADYLVERVDGDNVRGWELAESADRRELSVELLTAVKQQDRVTIWFSRPFVFAPGVSSPVSVPQVTVPDAALHRGVIQIRRSPVLELQTSRTAGVSRTDARETVELAQSATDLADSPLGVRDYQTYRFPAASFQIGLDVTLILPRVTAEARTLFRIGESELSLESEIQLSAEHRTIHQVDIAVPADLELEQVAAPGLSDWSIARGAVDGGQRAEGQVLTAFFSGGQTGRFPLSLRGKLADHTGGEPVPLPSIAVRAMDHQRGTIVIQVDPSLDARAVQLEQCRPVLLDRVLGWLREEQRPWARLALEYDGVGYRGGVAVTPRTPRVTCDTVTNVRITYREIQETILLDFQVLEAGVRHLEFRLPVALRDAEITAPMIRQRRVVPIDGEPYDRVTLDLQDAITGEYRVVVSHDRAIQTGPQRAPLPLVDTGTTRNRYVTVENAGRDELVVDATAGMEPVARPSRQWEQLAARLVGGDFATAFVSSQPGPQVELIYQTRRRERVQTAGARIGLARTELVLDAAGTYRAAMSLQLDNRTEPFLEIELPDEASLWTAHVAGQPVKPARPTGTASDRLLRIPLIKTAEGDLDFPVVLKYAGRCAALRDLINVQFPMIRTVNINIELSQVKLFLPDEYRWFDFDGNAARVGGEDDFVAGYVAYRTQQVEKLTEIIRGSNAFSQSRAAINVKALGDELGRLQTGVGLDDSNPALRQNLLSNKTVLDTATQEIRQLERREPTTDDNRDRLEKLYQAQRNTLTRNTVTRLGVNFYVPESTWEVGPGPQEDRFDLARFQRDTNLDRKKDTSGPEMPGMPGMPPADSRDAPEGPPDSPPQSNEATGGFGAAEAMSGRLRESQSQRGQPPTDRPEMIEAAQQVFQGAKSELQADRSGRARLRPSRVPSTATGEALNRAYADRIGQRAGEPEGLISQQDREASVTSGSEEGRQNLDRYAGRAGGAGPHTDFGIAGLSSLDFQLPQRGSVHFFTTPRGTVEITARPVDRRHLARTANFGRLLTVLAATWLFASIAGRLSARRHARTLTALGLLALGFLSLALAILPLFGAALVLGGILLLATRGQEVGSR